MAAFPQLRTGAITQYPSGKKLSFDTNVTRYVDGTEQRFRVSQTALRFWEVRLSSVTPAELSAVEEFFAIQQGRYGSFAFTDPWDGTEYPDCSLESDSLELRVIAESRGAMRLTIRNNRP